MFPSAIARKNSTFFFIGIVLSISPCFSKEVNPFMNPVFQDSSHWCWAASDFMVLHRYGNSDPQCKIVDNAFLGRNCCAGSRGSICNPFGESTIKKTYHLNADSVTRAIVWSEITSGINQDKPFIFTWNLTGGGSHIMVGVGYHTVTDGYNITGWVDYNDPLRGRMQKRKELFGSDPGHTTSLTLYNIQP
jgi:hypothetical protein